jgi:protein phosphatase
VGLVRAINEDACLDQPERGLWAVADGMGGHSVGDVASRMVVEKLSKVPSPTSLANFLADVRKRLQSFNTVPRGLSWLRRDAIGAVVHAGRR